MTRIFSIAIFIAWSLSSNAATVDTVLIHSKAMNKDFKCVVIRPALTQDENPSVPVVYLLHGYSGWYSNWLLRVPKLKDYADMYQMMIVCPDGGYGSWYFDSPIDPSIRFETYVSKEIPEYIESHYSVIKNKTGRAITGLSMGGHGGLFLGFRHPNLYGACGSMSGGVDLRPFKTKWDLNLILGDTISHWNNWNDYSVINVIEKDPNVSMAVIIDCGTEDFFYTVNHNLHDKLLELKIPHEYIERPGKHDWNYWSNSIQFQLLFFSNYFKWANK